MCAPGHSYISVSYTHLTLPTIHSVRPGTPIYYIDPNPASAAVGMPGVTIIKATATEGMKKLMDLIIPSL